MKQTDSCQKGAGLAGAGRGRDRLKGGEGINQRAFMPDPWTRSTMWGLAWDGDRGWVQVGKGEKMRTSATT